MRSQPVGDLPTDGAHVGGWLAGVMRGRNGRVVETQKHVVLDLSIALLQLSAVGVGGLKRDAAVDTPWPITPRLIRAGSHSGVTPFVDGTDAQPYSLPLRGTLRIPPCISSERRFSHDEMALDAAGMCEGWWAPCRAQDQTTSQTDARRVTQLYAEEDAWILTMVAVHRGVVLLAVLVIISMPLEASS